MNPIRILLADNKELFREGLAKVLEERPEIEVIDHCDNGRMAVEKARDGKPDVVLMEASLSGCDSIEATRRIKEESPNTKVAILTDSEDEDRLCSALKAGAKGYLSKNMRINTLVQSVVVIAEGSTIVSPPLGDKLVGQVGCLKARELRDKNGCESGLSEREIEILRLVARGASNKEIAETLIIAENTVKVHMKNILRKLHLKNKQQAAAYATQQGMVSEICVRQDVIA